MGELIQEQAIASRSLASTPSTGEFPQEISLANKIGSKTSITSSLNSMSALQLGKLEQIQGFFWANHSLQKVIEFSENLEVLDGFAVSLVTGGPFFGWDSEHKTIHLGRKTSGESAALDAGAVTHLISESLIDHLSEGRIYELGEEVKERSCGFPGHPIYKRNCCSTKFGCSQAVSAGLSDFLVAMLFPEFPSADDYLNIGTDPMTACALSRHPLQNQFVTADEAFGRCELMRTGGYVFNMASLLTSILWKVYTAASEDNAKFFSKIFIKTLSRLEGSDDFINYFDHFQQIALIEGAAVLAEALALEYQQRGLEVSLSTNIAVEDGN